MSELKYEKYILTDLKTPEDIQYRAEDYKKRASRILWLEDEVIKDSFSIILSWYHTATEDEGSPSHVHDDFDEVVGFIGSNPDKPDCLGGKVEFWMEDEKYLLDKSCLIWVPRGLRHCPLRVVEVEQPILFLAVSTTQKYTKEKIIKNYGEN